MRIINLLLLVSMLLFGASSYEKGTKEYDEITNKMNQNKIFVKLKQDIQKDYNEVYPSFIKAMINIFREPYLFKNNDINFVMNNFYKFNKIKLNNKEVLVSNPLPNFPYLLMKYDNKNSYFKLANTDINQEINIIKYKDKIALIKFEAYGTGSGRYFEDIVLKLSDKLIIDSIPYSGYNNKSVVKLDDDKNYIKLIVPYTEYQDGGCGACSGYCLNPKIYILENKNIKFNKPYFGNNKDYMYLKELDESLPDFCK